MPDHFLSYERVVAENPSEKLDDVQIEVVTRPELQVDWSQRPSQKNYRLNWDRCRNNLSIIEHNYKSTGTTTSNADFEQKLPSYFSFSRFRKREDAQVRNQGRLKDFTVNPNHHKNHYVIPKSLVSSL